MMLAAACLLPAALSAQEKYEINGIDMTRVEYDQFRNPDREP